MMEMGHLRLLVAIHQGCLRELGHTLLGLKGRPLYENAALRVHRDISFNGKGTLHPWRVLYDGHKRTYYRLPG